MSHAEARDWFRLGAGRHAANDFAGAAAAFARSIELESGNRQAHLALMTVLHSAGDVRAALAAARRAVSALPDQPEILYAVAFVLEESGEADAALAHYNRALSLDPRLEDAFHNRGLLLARLGRLEEVEANQRDYLAAHPRSARAHSGLADALIAAGRFDEALDWLDRLERIAPGDTGGRIRRGVALACLRRFTDARAQFDAARSSHPDEVAAYLRRVVPGAGTDVALSPENIFLWRRYLAQSACDWSGWEDYLAEMRRLCREPAVRVEPAVAFLSLHLPLSARERLEIARRVAGSIEASTPELPRRPARKRTRLRIGVLSPDFREHLNAYLLAPLMELLDRERFELYAYSLTADDGSAIRARVRAAADKFADFHELGDEDAARTIRSDDVDILVDAAGHTTGGRFGITARRPATLQVLYLGFPGSLGSMRIDYAIADRIVAVSAGEWSEQVVRLPNTYYLYDFRAPTPAARVAREDYGLPPQAFVYCAFHKAQKITPDAFQLWLDVLRRVPQSVLWMLDLSPAVRRNLARLAADGGIDPARLIFAPFEPRERYLARARLGDLFLDAVHHSAMTTACDALAAGLPVLSLKGSAMSSRAGESLLHAAGLPELVAPDAEAFVRIAANLAQPGALTGAKEKLSGRGTPLFDTGRRVRELGLAFEAMWTRALRAEPPASFDL